MCEYKQLKKAEDYIEETFKSLSKKEKERISSMIENAYTDGFCDGMDRYEEILDS